MKKLKEKIKLFKASIAYSFAKFKAQQRNHLTGKRQFVLMTDDGRLLVMDKTLFYKLRKRNHIPHYIQPHTLPKIAVWYTAATYKGKPLPAMHPTQTNRKRHRYLAYIRNLK